MLGLDVYIFQIMHLSLAQIVWTELQKATSFFKGTGYFEKKKTLERAGIMI